MTTYPTAFISYSWDNEEHKAWVRELATRLRADEIDVKLDKWDSPLGDHLPKFMETSIEANDFVLIVCTPNYKVKSENRVGGVGYEGDIITSDIFVSRNRKKYIPLLRVGDWDKSVPVWLQGANGVDLRGDPYPESNYKDLLSNLNGTRLVAPPIGVKTGVTSSTRKLAIKAMTDDILPIEIWEDIEIAGVILEEVTVPRNDSTRGSALYTVPLRLSRRPPYEWAELFVNNWNRPPQFTLMHRPGIASISGDKIILDGTTIEEIEAYHAKTFKLVIDKTNEQMAELRRVENQRRKKELEEAKLHTENVANIASRLSFNSKTDKQQERQEFLKRKKGLLWEALRKYEAYLADYPDSSTGDEQRHQRIIRDAILICKEIYDMGEAGCEDCLDIEANQPGFYECSHKCEKYLSYIAKLRLTPNRVVGIEGTQQEAEVARWGWYGNRNRNALHDAVDRLEHLISELE